jgi:GT2 family glycosyltransferase
MGKAYVEALAPGDGPRRVDWISGACIATRRDVLDRVGDLDESYFMYSEDTDWCHRVREAGLEIVQIPDSRVVHHAGASRVSNPMAAYHYYRSLLLYFRRHRPRSFWIARWVTAAGAATHGAGHAIKSVATQRLGPNPWWHVLRFCLFGDDGHPMPRVTP